MKVLVARVLADDLAPAWALLGVSVLLGLAAIVMDVSLHLHAPAVCS